MTDDVVEFGENDPVTVGVQRALRAKVGDRATEVMNKRSRYLAGLTLYDMARAP
jgi:hypothetical protein